MGKEQSPNQVNTRNSSKCANKKAKESTLNTANKAQVSPQSTFADKVKNNRQCNQQKPSVVGLSPSRPRASLVPRPSSSQSKPDNTRHRPASHGRSGKDQTVRASHLQPRPALKVNKASIDDNSDFIGESSEGLAVSILSEKSNTDNTMSKTSKQDKNKSGKDMNNAEMWAAVMSKLDSMQTQQSKEMQSLREEIKVTNSGFAQDIGQLRRELTEVKAKLQSQDAKWDSLQTFKQSIIDEVEGKIASQVSTQVNPQLAHLDEKISKQITSEVSQVEEKITEKLEEKLEDKQAAFHDDFVEKTEDDIHDIKRDMLKEKCHNRILNLILLGLEEAEEEEDEKEKVAKVLKDRLAVTYLKIDVVYRLGARTAAKRPRPIMIVFSRLASRKAVWYAKSKLNEGQETKLRLQEDLPPRLRWELSVLLKIHRQAKSMPHIYPKVRIKDYKIIINGTAYGVEDEDLLPPDLQLAAIATPQSEAAVAFFGRDSPFSNHFPCDFESDGLSFNCMEQFLACHKAKTANNRGLVTKIMRSSDPADHKKALNSMKEAVKDKWSAKVEDILAKGLRAKFGQNKFLKDILLATNPRKIGEASRDPVWGTGFPLNDEKVLDVEAWNQDGNLLGRFLEKVREEFLLEQQPTNTLPPNTNNDAIMRSEPAGLKK